MENEKRLMNLVMVQLCYPNIQLYPEIQKQLIKICVTQYKRIK
jgi:hypothetical protein